MNKILNICSTAALMLGSYISQAQIIYPFATVFSPAECPNTYQIDIQLSLDSVLVTQVYFDDGTNGSFGFEAFVSYDVTFTNSTLPPGNFFTFQPTLFSDNPNLNTNTITNNLGSVPLVTSSAGGFASQNSPTYTGSASALGLEAGKYYKTQSLLIALGYETASLHINLPCLDTTIDGDGEPLPVVWTDLKGAANGNEVTLEWKTTMERSSSHYDILKSLDAKKWDLTGSITSKARDGSSDEILSYSYRLVEDLAGKYYYKVVQNDIDGAQMTSKIIAVNVTGSKSNTLTLYPNPANLEVNLNQAISNTAYTIYNASGSVVQAGNYSSKIDISTLNPGIYIVKTLGKTSRLVVK